MKARVSSRGQPLPGKREDDQVVLAAIADAAVGQCGVCTAPLLEWWGWCPSCGTEIQWSAPANAGDQTTIR